MQYLYFIPVTLLLAYFGWVAWREVSKHYRRPVDRQPPEPESEPEPPTSPTWHALPGNQLELGDTGWRIELDVNRPDCDLLLWTPEGRQSATGREWQLDLLKRHAEICASNRAEFEATTTTDWRPS